MTTSCSVSLASKSSVSTIGDVLNRLCESFNCLSTKTEMESPSISPLSYSLIVTCSVFTVMVCANAFSLVFKTSGVMVFFAVTGFFISSWVIFFVESVLRFTMTGFVLTVLVFFLTGVVVFLTVEVVFLVVGFVFGGGFFTTGG